MNGQGYHNICTIGQFTQLMPHLFFNVDTSNPWGHFHAKKNSCLMNFFPHVIPNKDFIKAGLSMISLHIPQSTQPRHGVNSVPELELMGNSKSGIAYLKKMELELIKLNLEFMFATKKLNPQINLPFYFLIPKYFFHDNPH